MARQVEVVPAEPGRWPAVDAVMGTRGGDARCWCQYFHQDTKTWEARGRGNRDLLEAQVEGGEVPGLVALVDGEPAAWVAVAPRCGYERIARSPIMRPSPERDGAFEDPAVWAITCFVVRKEFRGDGLMTALIDAAVDHAASLGATAVEAYPVDTDGPTSAENLYYGVLSTFLDAGFRLVDQPKPTRARVRHDL